tara:strand:+ start:273 stop:821 length:549 start_codon:yes stop_codon:yes gene_type:complete
MKNFPTSITISRFLFAIVVSFLLFINSDIATILAVIMFILGSLSDALDGAFARRQSAQSKFGAFLDPIADKFLVFLVLISLVANRDSILLFIITIFIISREIFIMSLREWVATSDNGKIVKVSTLGKIKTIIQMAGISLVIGSPLIKGFFYFEISIIILILGTLISYYSAFEYFKKSFSYIK